MLLNQPVIWHEFFAIIQLLGHNFLTPVKEQSLKELFKNSLGLSFSDTEAKAIGWEDISSEYHRKSLNAVQWEKAGWKSLK